MIIFMMGGYTQAAGRCWKEFIPQDNSEDDEGVMKISWKSFPKAPKTSPKTLGGP